MNKSPNTEKFLNCSKHCTVECPNRDDTEMKNICHTEKWTLILGKPIDILTNADYQIAGRLCEKCDAFSPELNKTK